MVEVNYSDMDGLQVLWHLLTTEPFFWVILSIGFIAIGFSIWIDRYWDNDPDIKHHDETHHINR